MFKSIEKSPSTPPIRKVSTTWAATVTFRDINDTTDRIVATMADSERATVVLDLT